MLLAKITDKTLEFTGCRPGEITDCSLEVIDCKMDVKGCILETRGCI